MQAPPSFAIHHADLSKWDAENPYAQIGCPTGNCLRSQVNLTETINSFVMITKAGVPSNKVVAGVTSYGRSFAMADPGCTGPDCFFTGGPWDPQAAPGRCTGTGGYIADAEINEILAGSTTNGILKRDGRVSQHYVDPVSNSDILVYDIDQWVAYMSPLTKLSRQSLYKGLNLGGISDWATDLQKYLDPPIIDGAAADDWAAHKKEILNQHSGNWTELQCTDEAVSDIRFLCPAQRWSQLDAPHAWSDALNVWEKVDKGGGLNFTTSISLTFDGPENVECGTLSSTSNCAQTLQCDGFANEGSGPAGYLIWNSMVYVHEVRIIQCLIWVIYANISVSYTSVTRMP